MELNYKMIGKRLRKAREEQNLTQEYLAEQADISVAHMSRIETGKTKPSTLVLVALCDALAVSVDSILCDSLPSIKKPVYNNYLQEVLKGCKPEEVRMIVEIAEAVLKSAREAYKK